VVSMGIIFLLFTKVLPLSFLVDCIHSWILQILAQCTQLHQKLTFSQSPYCRKHDHEWAHLQHLKHWNYNIHISIERTHHTHTFEVNLKRNGELDGYQCQKVYRPNKKSPYQGPVNCRGMRRIERNWRENSN
jgi:hypothetical protein